MWSWPDWGRVHRRDARQRRQVGRVQLQAVWLQVQWPLRQGHASQGQKASVHVQGKQSVNTCVLPSADMAENKHFSCPCILERTKPTIKINGAAISRHWFFKACSSQIKLEYDVYGRKRLFHLLNLGADGLTHLGTLFTSRCFELEYSFALIEGYSCSPPVLIFSEISEAEMKWNEVIDMTRMQHKTMQ